MEYRAKWNPVLLHEMTEEQHRRFAGSLLDVEAYLRALRPSSPSEKRRAKATADYVTAMRLFLAAEFGDVYLPALDPDPEVWGELLESLEL